MVAAAVVTGRVVLPDGSPAAGALVRLRNADAQRSNFSVATDRQVFARADGRFLMLRDPSDADAAAISITVIVNWFDELNRLVPHR